MKRVWNIPVVWCAELRACGVVTVGCGRCETDAGHYAAVVVISADCGVCPP